MKTTINHGKLRRPPEERIDTDKAVHLPDEFGDYLICRADREDGISFGFHDKGREVCVWSVEWPQRHRLDKLIRFLTDHLREQP